MRRVIVKSIRSIIMPERSDLGRFVEVAPITGTSLAPYERGTFQFFVPGGTKIVGRLVNKETEIAEGHFPQIAETSYVIDTKEEEERISRPRMKAGGNVRFSGLARRASLAEGRTGKVA